MQRALFALALASFIAAPAFADCDAQFGGMCVTSARQAADCDPWTGIDCVAPTTETPTAAPNLLAGCDPTDPLSCPAWPNVTSPDDVVASLFG